MIKPPTSVLLVENQIPLAFSVSALLGSDDRFAYLGNVGTLAEAQEIVDNDPPDILIVEVALEDYRGLGFVRRVAQRRRGPAVVVWSAAHAEALAERLHAAGAAAFVSKNEDPRALKEALIMVCAGQRNEPVTVGTPAWEADPRTNERIYRLTDRDIEFVQHLGQGVDDEVLARKLRVKPQSVKAKRCRLKDKLNFMTTAELLRFAVQWVERQGYAREDVTLTSRQA